MHNVAATSMDFQMYMLHSEADHQGSSTAQDRQLMVQYKVPPNVSINKGN